jgi:hypothetical protein
MPTTFTSAQSLLDDPARANTSRLAPANISSGHIEFARIEYPLTAGTDEAAADLINLCRLPVGAIPIPELSFLTCIGDPGTAFTVDVGTAANPDGWGDGVALTATGKVEFTAAAHTAPEWLTPTPLVADTGQKTALVYATVVTSTSPTAGIVLIFTLAYKLNKG